jgi:SAM-dependent methyltransferase
MTHVDVADFERMYRHDPDPWSFATSEYEQRRYDLTVASLLRPRYQRAFEPGCAIGELTRRLATRCDQVVALEPSPTALAVARQRCADLANVSFVAGELPRDWPAATFDLVVLSELGYYFEVPELLQLRDVAVASLDRGGTLVAVHWRGHSSAHRLHGDEVHAHLAGAAGVRHAGSYTDDGFRLDLWQRA